MALSALGPGTRTRTSPRRRGATGPAPAAARPVETCRSGALKDGPHGLRDAGPQAGVLVGVQVDAVGPAGGHHSGGVEEVAPGLLRDRTVVRGELPRLLRGPR